MPGYNPAKTVIAEGLSDSARVNNREVSASANNLLRNSMVISSSFYLRYYLEEKTSRDLTLEGKNPGWKPFSVFNDLVGTQPTPLRQRVDKGVDESTSLYFGSGPCSLPEAQR